MFRGRKTKVKDKVADKAADKVTDKVTDKVADKGGGSHADMYRREAQQESVSLRFPVAMRPSDTTNDNPSWYTIIAEEVVEDPPKDDEHTYLRRSSTYKWRNLVFQILQLPYNVYWQVTVIVSIVTNMVISTLYYVFWMKLGLTDDCWGIFLFTVVASDVIYLCDVVVALVHNYWKSVRLLIKVQRRSKAALVLDVITLIPLTYASMFSGSYRVVYVEFWLRAITFLRMYRVQVLFRNWANSAAKSHWKMFAVRYILFFFILSHLITCFWFYGACTSDCDGIDTWTTVFVTAKTKAERSWHEWYLVSMYFAIATVCNAGLGEIYPITDHELIVSILGMALGFCLTTGFYIGSTTTQMVNSARRRSMFTDRVQSIEKHLESVHLSSQMKATVLKYYETLWVIKRGIKRAADYELLPMPLQMEVAYDINVAHFERSMLFRDLGEPFLRQLSLLMNHEFYLPGDVIFHQNVAKNMMICVASGVVEILSDEDNESPMISFGPGTILGEVSMLLTVPAKATVRAATYVELQILNKVDFFRKMINYPTIYARISQNITNRISSALMREATNDKADVLMSLFVSRHVNRTAISILKDRLRAMQKKKINRRKEDSSDDKEFNSTWLGMYRLSKNIGKKSHVWICMSARFPFILEPNTFFTHCWDYFIFALALFVAFLFPLYAGYSRKFPPWLQTSSYLITMFFVLDLCILCSTAIRSGITVVDTFMEIVYKRMTTFTFYLDLFACLPLEVAVLFMKNATLHLMCVLSLNRLLKVWRVPALFAKLEKNLWANLLLIRVVKYVTLLLIISHWAGVLLYMIACYDVQCDENSWFHQMMYKEIHEHIGVSCYAFPSITSMYFGLNLLSGVGYGDIYPIGIGTMVTVSFLMVLGVLVFGWGIAEFSATYTALGRQRVEYQQMLFAIQRFMVENNILPAIYDRVVAYLQLQWSYNCGLKVMTDKSPIDDATLEMKQGLLSKERMDVIMDVPLFSMTDMDYIQMVAAGSKILMLPPNEIVTYSGSISREMYIVRSGYCSIEKENTSKSKQKRYPLGPSTYFGDMEMLFGIPMAVTVRTITHCKIICLEYSVFMQSISLFPVIMNELQVLMNEFSEQIREVGLKRKKLQFERLEVTKLTLTEKLRSSSGKWSKEIRESFVDVKKKCKASKESYIQPFAAMGNMRWLRFLLCRFCILPGSRFLKIWAFFRVIAALLVGLIGPLQVGISPYSLHLAEVINVLDVFAYVDIYLMLHVGYYNEDGLLITHTYKTARYYLTHSFIVDLVACFPFEFLLLLLTTHTEGHTAIDHIQIIHPQHCMARLNRVIQLHRLPEAIAYLESDILRKTNLLRVIKFIPFTFIFINICAGVLTSLTCRFRYVEDSTVASDSLDNTRMRVSDKLEKALDDLEARNSLAKPIVENNASFWIEANATSLQYHLDGSKSIIHHHPEYTKLDEGVMHCSPGTWFAGSHFSEMQLPYGVYIIAYYWVTTTVTSVGFGDITAENRADLCGVIFMIIFGILMFGYMFASIASCKATSQNTDSLYQEKISELVSFLEQEGVDKHLKERIINHFEYIWRRTNGVQSHMVFAKLHTALMADAVLWMYERTLREVPLFENVEASFFRVIGRHMRQAYFLRGETIIRSQDVQSMICIIYRGKVEVLSRYNEMIACMGPGGMFGNIANISASMCSITVVASRNVDALMIPSDLFYQTLKNYPSVLKKMQNVMTNAKDYIMPTTIIHEGSSTNIHIEGEGEGEGEHSANKASAEESMSMASMRTISMTVGSTDLTTGSTGTIGVVGTIAYLILPWKWFKFGLLPNSIIYRCISILVIIVAYFDCLIISYSFAFQEQDPVTLYVSLGIEFIFYFKVFVDLHEAYLDEYGDYICDNKRIRKHYCMNRRRFWWDLIPNLPVEVLCFAFPRHKWLFVCNCLRLLHLLRFKYIIDYFVRRSNLININNIIDQSLIMLLVVTLVAHFSACVWYLLSCPLSRSDCLDYTWGYYQLAPGIEEIRRYLKSLYFIFGVFTTTGYGDVVPHGLGEVSFIIFFMLLSKFFVALLIGDVTSLVTSTSSTLVNYEYGVNELRDSLLNQYVSSHQQEKVWNYVQQLWTHGRGKQMPRFIDEAPYVLKCDVMNSMYGHHLRNSYVFAKLDEDFLRQLTVRLSHFVYFEGNYIVQHGDTDHIMYFVHRGEVDVLTVHNNLTETIHDVLKPGDVFGVAQGLFHGLSHHFSFRARTIVDIVTLNLDSWYGMLEFFPEAKVVIYERAGSIYSQV